MGRLKIQVFFDHTGDTPAKVDINSWITVVAIWSVELSQCLSTNRTPIFWDDTGKQAYSKISHSLFSRLHDDFVNFFRC